MVPSVVVRWRCSLFKLAAALFCMVTPPDELLRIICCGGMGLTFGLILADGGVACPLAGGGATGAAAGTAGATGSLLSSRLSR